jgi:hypothetical protein
MEKTVTYFSQSMLVSKVFWFNVLAVLAEILSLSDVLTIVPPGYHGHFAAAVGIINVILRRFTVRPASFIAPGDTKPVEVKKIGPDDDDDELPPLPPPASRTNR